MTLNDLTAIRSKAYEDLEDPIAQLASLVTVARKFQEVVLEHSPSAAELIPGWSKDNGLVIALSEDEYEGMNFVMLELVHAVRELKRQYFDAYRVSVVGEAT